MNKSERLKVAARIQKAHEIDSQYRDVLSHWTIAKAHQIHDGRAVLGILLADAERDAEVCEIELGFLHDALNIPHEPKETAAERLQATAHKYANAERENDKLQKSSDLFEITTNNLQIALREQETENDALREYAEHRSFCASWTQNGFGECDCKLDEILNKGVSDVE